MSVLYQFLAICQGRDEGEFVGVFDVAAGGHAASDPGNFDLAGFQLFFQIESGQVTFGGGIGRQDNFLYAVICYPMEELVDTESITVVALAAFQEASQNVVETKVGASTFDSDDIEWFFHEAEGVSYTFGIGADGAEFAFGDMETACAAFQVMERFEALRKALEFLLVLFEEVEYDAFSHFGADGGESGKMCYQGLEDLWIMHLKRNYELRIMNKEKINNKNPVSKS